MFYFLEFRNIIVSTHQIREESNLLTCIFNSISPLIRTYVGTVSRLWKRTCKSFQRLFSSFSRALLLSSQVLGPHSHLQLFLVGGLFDPWRMPILYAFDQAVTKTMLMRAISAVETAGGQVVSIVCDMGGSNMSLWKDLGIKHDGRVSISNPMDPERYLNTFCCKSPFPYNNC